MSDDANVNMALYSGLLPAEEKKLRGIENDVLRVLFGLGFSARPIWTIGTNTKGRVVKLFLLTGKQTTTVFELPSSELAVLSEDELLSRLNESIGRQCINKINQ